MATLTSALNTSFTPAAGTFVVQCNGGLVRLERQNSSGAAWAMVGDIKSGQAQNVDNPVAGPNYRFIGMVGTPVIQADQ